MPFDRETDKVLAGGLNLLAGADLAGQDEALVLQNWRPEAGRLHSRRGSHRHLTIPTPGYIHTISHSGGTPSVYLGIDTELYRGNSSIQAGFDRRPLGIVGFQQYAWVMNQNVQRKDDGSTVSRWLPDRPAGKPTATAQAQDKKNLSLFESSESWTTLGATDSPTPFFDGPTSQEGASSLRLITEAAGSARADGTPLTSDFGMGGEQNDDDLFKIWLFATNPAAIQNVHVMVDVNDGTFEQDYYRFTISGADLNLAWTTWSEVAFFRKRRVIPRPPPEPPFPDTGEPQQLPQVDEGEIVDRIGFDRQGNTPGKDWSTAQKVRVQVDASEALQFHFDNFHVLSTVTGPFNGEYDWAVTFVNKEGHETNPSDFSSPVQFDAQFARLTGIPVSNGTQGVTKRRIYRRGGLQAATVRVGEINDDITTTFEDKVSEDDATALGIRLESDHDPPPAARGLVGPYFERLLAYNSAAHRNRLWWTPTSRPWYFRGSDDPDDGDWVDVGEDGEDLVFVSTHKRTAWLYKTGSIWRLVGNPDDGDLEPTNAGIGVVGPQAVAEGDGVDYICARDGVYVFNGDQARKISEAVDPLFRGQYVELSAGPGAVYAPPLDPEHLDRVTLAYAYGRLYVSYPALGRSGTGQQLQNNSDTLIYDTLSGRWHAHKLASAFTSTGFTALHFSKVSGALLAATLDGNVLSLEQGGSLDDLNGNNRSIPLIYQSGYRFQGVPDNDKRYEDVVIDFNTSFIPAGGPGASLTVKAYFDYGASNVTLGTIQGGVQARKTFRINAGKGKDARNIAIRIEGDTTSEVTINEITVHFYGLPRLARSYDSEVLDLGSALVKEFDELEIEIEPSSLASLAWEFHSDMPDREVKARLTGTIMPDSLVRKVYPIPFSSVIQGRRFRVLMSGDPFRLYNIRVRRKSESGVYFDGAAGESWESSDLSFVG